MIETTFVHPEAMRVGNFLKIPEVVNLIGSMKFNAIAHVGSTYITDGGKDIDILLLADQAVSEDDSQCIGTGPAYRWLIEDGYTECSSGMYPSDQFVAMRKGPYNVLLCVSLEYYQRWLTAAKLCRKLFELGHPMDKPIRVMIHQAIMDGNFDDAPKKLPADLTF